MGVSRDRHRQGWGGFRDAGAEPSIQEASGDEVTYKCAILAFAQH